MGIDLSDDPRGRWLVARPVGSLDIEDLLVCLKIARTDVGRRFRPLLFDTRGAHTTVTEAELERAVAMAAELGCSEGRRAPVAILVDSNQWFDLMVYYETRCADVGIPVIRTFRQLTQALRWLDAMTAIMNFR